MIRITDYNEQWPEAFDEIRECLHHGLGGLDVTILHIGSTAVPGLASKPMLDIHLVVGPDSDMSTVVERLAVLGYIHEGDLDISGREAFRRKGPDVPFRDPKRDWYPHHLYASTAGAEELLRHLAFRDHLRSHSDDRSDYDDLKRKLAEDYPDDPDAYVQGKREFVEEILAKIDF